MITKLSFYDYIDYLHLQSVSQIDFYRTVFPEGTLEKEGEQVDAKYTGVIRYDGRPTRMLHDELSELPILLDFDEAKMSLISYAGHGGKKELARELHGLVFPIFLPHGMDRMTFINALRNLFERHTAKKNVQPRICPTFALTDVDNVYFVYVLEKPLPMYYHLHKKIQKLYNFISREIHKGFDAYNPQGYKKPHPASIFKAYPVVDSVTSKGTICEAYRLGDTYTIDELDAIVPKSARVGYKESTMTLEEAKELYPVWNERTVVQKRKPSGKRFYVCKPEVYTWFLDLVDNNIDIVSTSVFEALASYAIKCQVSSKKLVEDLDVLKSKLSARMTKDEISEHINNAIYLADNRPSMLHRWSRKYISKIIGVEIKPNKRNYRTQKEHLELVHKSQSAEEKVNEWRKNNPTGTRKECIAELGLSKTTVYKWWKKEDTTKNKTKISTKHLCPECKTKMTKKTRRWFWDEKGNYYKRTDWVCETCGTYKHGKTRIDA